MDKHDIEKVITAIKIIVSKDHALKDSIISALADGDAYIINSEFKNTTLNITNSSGKRIVCMNNLFTNDNGNSAILISPL